MRFLAPKETATATVCWEVDGPNYSVIAEAGGTFWTEFT